MENFYIVLDQDLMVDRLISNVRVKSTSIGYATYTEKRHHGIKAGITKMNCGIGIDKAEQNLESTMKENVRSSINLHKCKYRTEFLSQRLGGLNCRFYTDKNFKIKIYSWEHMHQYLYRWLVCTHNSHKV